MSAHSAPRPSTDAVAYVTRHTLRQLDAPPQAKDAAAAETPAATKAATKAAASVAPALAMNAASPAAAAQRAGGDRGGGGVRLSDRLREVRAQTEKLTATEHAKAALGLGHGNATSARGAEAAPGRARAPSDALPGKARGAATVPHVVVPVPRSAAAAPRVVVPAPRGSPAPQTGTSPPAVGRRATANPAPRPTSAAIPSAANPEQRRRPAVQTKRAAVSPAAKPAFRRPSIPVRGALATHMCLWERQWFPVSVLRRTADRWRVHYSGFQESSDEWVTLRSGRLRPLTTSADAEVSLAVPRARLHPTPPHCLTCTPCGFVGLQERQSLVFCEVEKARALEPLLPMPADVVPLPIPVLAATVRTALDSIAALTLRVVWVPVVYPSAGDGEAALDWRSLAVAVRGPTAGAPAEPFLWWPAVATGRSAPPISRRSPIQAVVVPLAPDWTVDDACRAAVAALVPTEAVSLHPEGATVPTEAVPLPTVPAAAGGAVLEWTVPRPSLRLWTMTAPATAPDGTSASTPLVLPLGTPAGLGELPAEIRTLAVEDAASALGAHAGAGGWARLWTRTVDTASALYLTACLAGRVARVNVLPVRPDGHGLDAMSIAAAGQLAPCVIADPAGLAMQMPHPDWLTYARIADLLGHEHKVPVIDVDAQRETTVEWTLAEVARYFSDGASPSATLSPASPSTPPTEPGLGDRSEPGLGGPPPTTGPDHADWSPSSPPLRRRRERTLNVLSLEISHTDLAKAIVPPTLVRDLDWAELVWPAILKPASYPRVQLYCLMSAEGRSARSTDAGVYGADLCLASKTGGGSQDRSRIFTSTLVARRCFTTSSRARKCFTSRRRPRPTCATTRRGRSRA